MATVIDVIFCFFFLSQAQSRQQPGVERPPHRDHAHQGGPAVAGADKVSWHFFTFWHWCWFSIVYLLIIFFFLLTMVSHIVCRSTSERKKTFTAGDASPKQQEAEDVSTSPQTLGKKNHELAHFNFPYVVMRFCRSTRGVARRPCAPDPPRPRSAAPATAAASAASAATASASPATTTTITTTTTTTRSWRTSNSGGCTASSRTKSESVLSTLHRASMTF